MIIDYNNEKEKVLGIYEDLNKIIDAINYSRNDASLHSLEKQAEDIKNNRFCMMVAGEAKSGKSTFINAYLKTEILPMDVFQCTSALVEIGYAPEFDLVAEYANGNKKIVKGEKNIKQFLSDNAAVNECYRDIPTTLINDYILQYKSKSIPEEVVKDLFKAAESANIFDLPSNVYNKKIREYLEKKHAEWQKIVVKIVINYPFEDKEMRGIKIIDSPGVNAEGLIGDVSQKYIESANSILFLRPITGSAIEAIGFKKFLESKSVDRNKNALFLLLTRSATEAEATINKALDGFKQVFGVKENSRRGVPSDQIISIDSKAELYRNRYLKMTMDEIDSDMKKLNQSNELEPFVYKAMFNAGGDKDRFMDELGKISNFDLIRDKLNTLGRRAQFIALSEFLERLLRVYEKIAAIISERIKNYELKAKDPDKLRDKINAIESELASIENRITSGVVSIQKKYTEGEANEIEKRASEVIKEYKESIDGLDPVAPMSVDQLEKLTFRYIDKYTEYQSKLKNDVIAECDEVLRVAIPENSRIHIEVIKPDITPELIHKIKEDMHNQAQEEFTTGNCIKKTKVRFVQERYFNLIRDGIDQRLTEIEPAITNDLVNFVVRLTETYQDVLAQNSDELMEEHKKTEEELLTAIEIQSKIELNKAILKQVTEDSNKAREIKGGIDNIDSMV